MLLLSPNANASTKPENVPFLEADLGAHVLRMCPLAWQDQYSLNQKGMMPMDMHMFLTSLEAIERVCTHEKGKPDEKSEKSSFNGKKGKNGQVLILRSAFPRKSDLRRIVTCVRNMGVHIPLTRLVNVVSMRKTELKKSSFRATKKGSKTNYPVNQNFAQLTKKIEKLEKTLKKSGKKGKKRRYEDSDSNSE
jgi:hypothetical protein